MPGGATLCEDSEMKSETRVEKIIVWYGVLVTSADGELSLGDVTFQVSLVCCTRSLRVVRCMRVPPCLSITDVHVPHTYYKYVGTLVEMYHVFCKEKCM